MALFSKLFGGSGASAPEAATVEYEGFRITPEPAREAGGFRIGARIEKDVDGQTRTHQMIRADTYQSAETATEASISKARQLIDQQGEAIFG